jgi:butyryl-CoA dehydrogenase
VQRLGAATKSAWATGVAEEALANATPYLQAFGHVVIAWMWLDVALAAQGADEPRRQGAQAACRYFFAYELPLAESWLKVVTSREPVCREMQDQWF